MSSLDSFKELTKDHEDLLRKDFYFGRLMIVTLSAYRNSSEFHSRLSLNESGANYPVFASAWERLTWGDLSLKGKKQSDGKLKLSSSYTSPSYPLKVTLNYQQVSESSNIQLEYKTSSLFLELLCKPEVFSLSFNTGNSSFGFGGLFSSDYLSFLPKSPTLILWSKVSNSKFFLKHQSQDSNLLKPGTIEFGLLKKQEKTEIASSAKYIWGSKSLFLSVGGLYKIDSQTSMKGRIASNGRVGLVHMHKLSESISSKISLETPCFPFRPNGINDLKFGLRLDLNF
jgi:hypothetical protein